MVHFVIAKRHTKYTETLSHNNLTFVYMYVSFNQDI